MKTIERAAPALSMGRRMATLASWTFPGAVLTLLPKCPACIAAYAALWTGIGLSMPVAAGLRLALMLMCIVSLVFLAYRQLRRLVMRRSSPPRRPECPQCPALFVIFNKE